MAVKLHETKTTVGDAIVDGYSILQALRDEDHMLAKNEDDMDAAKQAVSDLDDAIGSAESVDFPGMYS